MASEPTGLEVGADVLTAAPLRLEWQHRDVQMPWPGEYRVTVGVSGGPAPPDAGRRLTAALELLWIIQPHEEFPPTSSVVAILVPDPRMPTVDRLQLHLVVSLAGRRADPRIDSPMMARHLRAALRGLAG